MSEPVASAPDAAPPAPARPRPSLVLREYRVKTKLRRSARDVLLASPGYAFAGFVHLLALVLLSFWSLAAAIEEARRPIEVRLAAQSDVAIATPAEVRPQDLDALAPPDPETVFTRPEVDHDQAFQEALGSSAGNLAESARAFGLGASGGFGRGGARGGRGGPSSASESALRGGLDWLVRHRCASGAWADLPRGHGADARLALDGEVPHTALALLCFLCADHGPEKPGPYRDVVKTAIAWLVERARTGGVFDGHYNGYHQGIGLLALSEALARQRTPELERAVQRVVRCVEDAQSPSGGWRYRPLEAADTSVTSWVALGLKAAEHAGATVQAGTWDTLDGYVEAVSRADGTTGYTHTSGGSVAMGASGLFLRLMLGESPERGRNVAAADLMTRLASSLEVPAQRTDHAWDLYAVYYAALAMYQVGGERWDAFNPRVRDGLVALQRTDGCEAGSWTAGAGYAARGLTLGTVFALLSLETYYRYLPVHGGGAGGAAVESRAGAELLGEAIFTLERAAKEGDKGLLLAAEAQLEAAVLALYRSPSLCAEARARLVQCAALAGDGERALARADEYLAALPAGTTPEVPVLRVRRGELVRRAIEAARAAAAPGAPDAALEVAGAALRAAEQSLEAEREALSAGSPEQAEEARAAAGSLGALRVRLTFALGPDQAIDAAQAELTGPGEGPATQAERLALQAALDRAIRDFAAVTRGEAGPEALDRAQADLGWVETRARPGRLPDEDLRRLAADLEQADLARLYARLAARRDLEAAQGAAAFRERHPGSVAHADVDAVERAALSRRVEQGVASPAERERLVELLTAWARSAPESDRETPWVDVGDALLACGLEGDADRCYERALGRSDLAADLAARARFARAQLARRRGAPDAAEEHLRALDPDRADVRLLRCELQRDRGQLKEALEGYLVLLRALDEERPDAWWEAAIGTAETYAAMNEPAQARRFLADLRRRDPALGGDGPRKRRIVELMVRLDASR